MAADTRARGQARDEGALHHRGQVPDPTDGAGDDRDEGAKFLPWAPPASLARDLPCSRLCDLARPSVVLDGSLKQCGEKQVSENAASPTERSCRSITQRWRT